MNVNHPYVARATPPSAVLPAGFERTRVNLATPLPIALPVAIPGFDGALVLALGSGRIRGWIALAAEEPIATGAEHKAPQGSAAPVISAFATARARLSPILMVLAQGRLADIVPVTVGLRQIVSAGEERRAVCELIVLDFHLTASSVNSASPGGSWIDLALRPLAASESFEAPIAGAPYPQIALQRTSGAVAFDMRFDSVVRGAPGPGGVPVGGLNWWLANERA